MRKQGPGMRKEIPADVRAACEACMLAVRGSGASASSAPAAACFRAATSVLRRVQPRSAIEGFVEYAALPALMYVPPEVPEEEREELPGLEAALELLRELVTPLFARRQDLRVEFLLRGLSTLSGADGTVRARLREDTKLEAVRLVGAVARWGVDDQGARGHGTLVLLEVGTRERSRELREAAVEALEAMVAATPRSQVVLMFPGVASGLCELARWNVRAGSRLPELALRVLERVAVEVLADVHGPGRAEEIGGPSPLDQLKRMARTHHARGSQKKKNNNNKLEESAADGIFPHLEPLLLQLWRDGDEYTLSANIRAARCRLVRSLLVHCSACMNRACKVRLMGFVITSAAAATTSVTDPEDGEVAAQALREILERHPAYDVFLGEILQSTLVGMSQPSQREDEHALSASFGVCAYIISVQSPVRTRGVFESALGRIVLSLLQTFEYEVARFEQLGSLEFARLSAPSTKRQAREFFAVLRGTEAGRLLFNRLFDCVVHHASAVSVLPRGKLDEDEDEDNPKNKNNFNYFFRILPKSCLPQCLYLMSQLSDASNHTGGDETLDRLLEDVPRIWTFPTRPGKACSPQEASANALIRCGALQCMGAIARDVGPAFKFRLVDALFPLLQMLGDEHPGVRACAQTHLDEIAAVCEYSSSSALLQENVDYVVDAMVSRLPQMSAHDARFVNVMEALIQRIPVWTTDEEESPPWIRDLIQALLDGLDRRAFSPHVSWSLLRIAEAVVRRAPSKTRTTSETTPSNPNGGGEFLQTLILQVQHKDEAKLEAALGELGEWGHKLPGATSKDNVEGNAPDHEEKESEEEAKERISFSAQAVESLLKRVVNFFPDDDVLVRRQAVRVAAHCMACLRNHTRIRQLAHEIWPSIVEQLREETHPPSVALLLDTLTATTVSVSGKEFLASRFADEAWPVLEARLDRAHPGRIKRHAASLREKETAKAILACLVGLGDLLAPRAERVARATAFFIDAGTRERTPLDAELKLLAVEVWKVLACVAGDAIWLCVAGAADVELNRREDLVLQDASTVQVLWNVLQCGDRVY